MSMDQIKSRSGQSGFTLIELMIVTAIIGILALPLLNMYVQAKKFAEDHYRFTVAATALQKEMESLKTMPAATIIKERVMDEGMIEDLANLEDGEAKLNVSNMPGYTTIKRIEVKIEWTNPWGQKRSLRSVILRPAQ